MAHSLEDLHQALADKIGAVTELEVDPHPRWSITPPHAFVALSNLEVVAMQRGLDQLEFEVYIFTGGGIEDGYTNLLPYASPTGAKSIRASLWGESNRTLGLTETDAYFAGFRMTNLDEVQAFSAWGGVFSIRVVTKGS